MSWPLRQTGYHRALLASGGSPSVVFAMAAIQAAAKYKSLNQARREEREAGAAAFDQLPRPTGAPPLPASSHQGTACADCGYHASKCRCGQ